VKGHLESIPESEGGGKKNPEKSPSSRTREEEKKKRRRGLRKRKGEGKSGEHPSRGSFRGKIDLGWLKNQRCNPDLWVWGTKEQVGSSSKKKNTRRDPSDPGDPG